MSIKKTLQIHTNIFPIKIGGSSKYAVIGEEQVPSVDVKDQYNFKNISQFVSHITKQQQKKLICNVPSLKNNSCYIDTVIVAMLLVPNVFTSSFILGKKLQLRTHTDATMILTNTRDDLHNRKEIQRELVKIARSMRVPVDNKNKRSMNMDVLRILMSRCSTTFDFDNNEQGDACEFLLAISSMFDLDNVNERRVDIFATNNVLDDNKNTLTLTSTRTEKCGFVVRIVDWDDNEHHSMKKFLFASDDSGALDDPLIVRTTNGKNEYYRVLTETMVVPRHCVVFHVDRTLASETVNRKKLLFIDDKIENLKLCFIILHSDAGIIGRGHFTCLVKTEIEGWLYYNNMTGLNAIESKSFIDMCDTYNVYTQCVLLGYVV